MGRQRLGEYRRGMLRHHTRSYPAYCGTGRHNSAQAVARRRKRTRITNLKSYLPKMSALTTIKPFLRSSGLEPLLIPPATNFVNVRELPNATRSTKVWHTLRPNKHQNTTRIA